jgi:HK97 family phage major capsid protein
MSIQNAETLTAPEFQKAAGATLASIEDQNHKLVANYDQLDKTTKKAFEELTTLKNKHTDDIAAITTALSRVKLALGNERRTAFANPIDRITRDAEKRNLFVAMLAKALGGEVLEACGPKIRDLAKGLTNDNGLGRSVTKANLAEGTTTGATFVDTNEVENDIYDVLAMFGAYRTVDFRMVGAKATEIPVKSARAIMLFTDEAAAITPDATKAATRVTITPKKIAGLIGASSELLEDDVVGVVNDILNDFAESTAERLDFSTFAAANASATLDGGFTGMFSGGTAVGAASGNVSIATLDFEDFVNVIANAPAGIINRPSKWWIHPAVLVAILKIKDLSGRPIFNTAIESPSAGAIGTILGYPVITVNNAPSTDGVSKKLAAFGDPQAMAVRMRRDLRIDRSEHYAFNTDEITFRATVRAGAKIKAATGIQVLVTAAS